MEGIHVGGLEYINRPYPASIAIAEYIECRPEQPLSSPSDTTSTRIEATFDLAYHQYQLSSQDKAPPEARNKQPPRAE
jgi:hypothetical protein